MKPGPFPSNLGLVVVILGRTLDTSLICLDVRVSTGGSFSGFWDLKGMVYLQWNSMKGWYVSGDEYIFRNRVQN